MPISRYRGLGIVVGIGLALFALMAITPARALPTGHDNCVDVVTARGAEYLVNRCGQCRTAEVERQRPGMEKPTQHTYTLPTGAPLQLSFLGPGFTRVRSDRACPGTTRREASADDGQACVSLQRSPQSGPVMLNECNGCRQVVLQRFGADTTQNKYLLAGRSYMPIQANGAAGARILSDGPCPN